MVCFSHSQSSIHEAAFAYFMYFYLYGIGLFEGYEVCDDVSSINPRPLVPVSSLSIFALVLSFVILLVYGFVKNGIVFNSSMLVPSSLVDMLSSIGVASFSLGYNFSFLSFYVRLYTPSHIVETSQTFYSSESEKSNCPLYCSNNHISHLVAPPRISFLLVVSRWYQIEYSPFHPRNPSYCNHRLHHDVFELSLYLSHLLTSTE